jgi:hypothetical protein
MAAAQAPMPLQVWTVSTAPLQAAGPHSVEAPGKMQAPVPSQPVAPQVTPTGLQAVVQQSPVPLMPQTPDVHWSLLLHTTPPAPLIAHTSTLQK